VGGPVAELPHATQNRVSFDNIALLDRCLADQGLLPDGDMQPPDE
jgi:hypothetical protein